MQQQINGTKNISGQQEGVGDYDDFGLDSLDGFYLDEELPSDTAASGDSYSPQLVPPDANQLRFRLNSLLSMLDGDSGDKDQVTLRKQVELFRNQVNYVMSLKGPARDAEMYRLNGEIGQLELQVVGAADGAEGAEGDGSDLSLAERRDELQKKIDKFENKGWISEELHDKLAAKLSRVDDLIGDEDLEDAAESLIEEIEGDVDSIKQMYVEQGEEIDHLEGEEAEVKNGTLDALLGLTGVSEKQAMAAYKAAFPSGGINSAKDLAKAIEGEQAPFTAPPSAAVIKFLENIDAEFAQAVAGCKTYQKESIGPNLEKASARLSALLNAVYGDDHIIRATQTATGGDYSDWRLLNEITFDGTSYSFTGESKGRTAQVTWEVLNADGKPAPAGSGSAAGGLLGGVPGVPDLPGPGDEIANKVKGYVDVGGGFVKKGVDKINPLNW